MNLRLRLVAALVGLVTVGFAIFGVTTYGFYSRAQYDRLDDDLHDLSQPVGEGLVQLAEVANQIGEPGVVELPLDGDLSGSGQRFGGPPGDTPGPGSYAAELRSLSTGQAVGWSYKPYDTDDLPDLPDELEFDGHDRWMDVGSVGLGTTQWRVLVTSAPGHQGPIVGRLPGAAEYFVVVAVPMTGVQSSLNRLALIELVAALGLLVAVAAGAWLVLRQGLQPLERMASTASTITAGHLDARIEPADERSEVGQLGLALNTMLGRLEGAFAEREATEQRLRQFLADASHELRTPLTSIQGFAELFRLAVEGDQADQVDLPVTLRRIEEESARMHHLVDDLLLLARLDQTRPIERAPVDLAVVAADACTDAVAVDPTRTVTLDAPTPVVVQGDSDHLRQAVTNLVANAVRHTPPGTPLEVGAHIEPPAGGWSPGLAPAPAWPAVAPGTPPAPASPSGTFGGWSPGTAPAAPGRAPAGSAVPAGAPGVGHAVVTVRDHGPGLEGEALAHAFDRFWQGDPSRADAGAGLGLSIVAAIAAEHGGTASVVNAEDGGALFTLRLPLA